MAESLLFQFLRFQPEFSVPAVLALPAVLAIPAVLAVLAVQLRQLLASARNYLSLHRGCPYKEEN